MIFVHPVHFLVAGPDGSIVADARFGGSDEWEEDVRIRFPLLNTAAALHGMVIGTEQIDTPADVNGIGYSDLPLAARRT